MSYDPYWKVVWLQFRKNRVGMLALWIFSIFFFIGLYAPFFASSKPIIIQYHGDYYFPLFRYLFYRGFYTKPIDLFYNLLMFTFPITLVGTYLIHLWWKKTAKYFIYAMVFLHVFLFLILNEGLIKNPEDSLSSKKKAIKVVYHEDPLLNPFFSLSSDWKTHASQMSSYEKINLLLRYQQRKAQHEKLSFYSKQYREKTGREMPTLWEVDQRNLLQEKQQLEEQIQSHAVTYQQMLSRYPQLLEAYQPYSHAFIMAKFNLEEAEQSYQNKRTTHQPALEIENARLERNEAQKKFEEVFSQSNRARAPLAEARSFIQEYQDAVARLNGVNQREQWLNHESNQLHILLPALFRPFHWEDDAGGQQSINKYVPWWDLTRVNRKDLASALLFGIRVSIVVGLSAVVLSLAFGIPLGMIAGYFAGKTDIVISRIIEVWEAMPTFFMLLMIVAIVQSKSIFIVVMILGIFGWTGIARYIRGEVLRQRNLPYVLACNNLGFSHSRVMFSHILPNAIPPVLTLLPFSMMAAITSEAGLSFLGLGEEGSSSWGVLMDEGRTVFPGESYLLWPPAILLTLLLISIALVGDALRDALDPKMRH